MPASLFASIFTFVITGLIAIDRAASDIGRPLHTDLMTCWVVFGILLLQAIYFFYIEACVEADRSAVVRLRQFGILEWLLRVCAQVTLVILWLALERDLRAFFLGVLALNCIYLFWDMLTWDGSPNTRLAWVDLLGFACAAITVLILYTRFDIPTPSSEGVMVVLGMACAGFIAQLILGFCWIRYPWKDFWANCS